jgi:hypothetical protein
VSDIDLKNPAVNGNGNEMKKKINGNIFPRQNFATNNVQITIS